jgi:hypothetical protein
MFIPNAAYEKWIVQPQIFLKTASLKQASQVTINTAHPSFNLLAEGKITNALRSSTSGAGKAIQEVLKKADVQDQFERDVAMWYGYCNRTSQGSAICLNIFSVLQKVGVLYKTRTDGWRDFGRDFPEIPVASMLSHGGRILFLLPMSNSLTREVSNTLGAFVKGITYDPLAAVVNRGTYHTTRMGGTVGQVAINVFTRGSGLASAGAILSTPSKMSAAGDDRFWNKLTKNNLHDRALASHSTYQTDWMDPPNLPGGRHLWFTEEKASGGGFLKHITGRSGDAHNLADSMAGRHYYKNVALGGVGNINPFSGVEIDANGAHGHLYVNYRAPQYKRFGSILLGVEGSAPGCENQYGKLHDAHATKGEFSATGGRKWESLLGKDAFYSDFESKKDVTLFVCDLSDQNTSKAMINIEGFSANQLGEPLQPVRPAIWDEVRSRI